jgi:hypothetical protein
MLARLGLRGDRSTSGFPLRDREHGHRVPLGCFQVLFCALPGPSPSPACFTGGRAWLLPRNPSTVRPVRSLFRLKGDGPRAHSSKKKTMQTNQKKNSGLRNRIAQHGKLPKIDFRKRHYNQGLSTEKALDLIRREAPDVWEGIQVVGRWLWLRFDCKQPCQITAMVSQLGFFWNCRRQLWQHPCGRPSLGSRRNPCQTYRTYFPADSQTA